MMKRIFLLVSCILMLSVISADATGVTYQYDDLHRLVRADFGEEASIVYVYDDVGNMTQKVLSETSLMVTLVRFEANVSSDGRMVLTWETLSETDNVGFYILRCDSEDGEYERITDFIIAAKGEATQGAVYTYTDDDADPDQTYYYKLEDIDFMGVASRSEPVSEGKDADNTGIASLSDVIRILQINAGMPLPAPANLAANDVRQDGKAGIEDAVRLLRVISLSSDPKGFQNP